MISIVIPLYNEEENIETLTNEIVTVSKSIPVTEIVCVNDASTDKTEEVLKNLKRTTPLIKIVSHGVQSGQTAAMWSGVHEAANDVVIFMDGDGQNDPADMIKVYQSFQQHAGNKTFGIMVAGQRVGRKDTWIKKISSRLANAIRSAALRDGTRDTGCSLKLVCKSDFLSLPYFDHMHRFLPALFNRDGVKVLHVDVSHRPRLRGVSKYGFWDRLRVGISDLLGVMWLCLRGRPRNYSRKLVD